ncbi:MAG: MFS transporter, partial [Gammaproteobacteria bacterium]
LMVACGWRIALAVIAVTSALAMLIAARFIIHDPETLGLAPDGDAAPLDTTLAPRVDAALADIRRSARFVLVIAIYFCSWLVVFMPFVHLPAHAHDLGHDAASAASLLAAIGLGGVAGRLSAGIVSDRIGRYPALVFVFALQAAAFAAFGEVTALAPLWLAALAFGFSYGGGVTLLPPLCGDLFGRTHMASIVGVIFAVAGAPAAFGPYAAGWLYDASGGYHLAFVGSSVLNLLALVLTGVLAMHTRRLAQR